METARITVCLPAYEAESYIGAAIESVLAQTCSDWRLLIADNGSTDGTADAARQYQDPRITTIEHPENLGMVANWRFLLQRVTTPYFCLLAADDYFRPTHLETKLALLEHQPAASMAFGAVDLIDASGAHLDVYREPFNGFEPSRKHFHEFFWHNFVNIAGAVVRMEPVRRHSIDFDPRFTVLCDWHFFMVLVLLTEGFVFDPNPTSVYRLHPKSVARQTEKTALWIRERVQLQLAVLDEHPVESAAWVDLKQTRQRITQDLWHAAARQWFAQNPKDAELFWTLFLRFHSTVSLGWRIPCFLFDRARRLIRGHE